MKKILIGGQILASLLMIACKESPQEEKAPGQVQEVQEKVKELERKKEKEKEKEQEPVKATTGERPTMLSSCNGKLSDLTNEVNEAYIRIDNTISRLRGEPLSTSRGYSNEPPEGDPSYNSLARFSYELDALEETLTELHRAISELEGLV